MAQLFTPLTTDFLLDSGKKGGYFANCLGKTTPAPPGSLRDRKGWRAELEATRDMTLWHGRVDRRRALCVFGTHMIATDAFLCQSGRAEISNERHRP